MDIAGALQYSADLAHDRAAALTDVIPIDGNAARCRADQAANHFDGSRLAGAVRPQETEDDTGRHSKVKVFYGMNRRVFA